MGNEVIIYVYFCSPLPGERTFRSVRADSHSCYNVISFELKWVGTGRDMLGCLVVAGAKQQVIGMLYKKFLEVSNATAFYSRPLDLHAVLPALVSTCPLARKAVADPVLLFHW